jgi:hypothetical protein
MPDKRALRGYFINLDRAPERRSAMEAQLRQFGLADSYARFPAVDGRHLPQKASRKPISDGEIAIFRSHTELLRQAAALGDHVHVLEDDVILSPQLQPFLHFATKAGLFSVYDIVFLDWIPPPDVRILRTLKNLAKPTLAKPAASLVPGDFRIVDVSDIYNLAAASYVVGPQSIAKVVAILDAELEAGPRIALDYFIRKEGRGGRLRVGSVIPFLTTVGIEEVVDTQSGRSDDTGLAVALTLIRRGFFVGQGLVELQGMVDDFLARMEADSRRDPFGELIYRLSGYLVSE